MAPAPKSQQTLPSVLPADPNTLFRSNSLASKAMEQFMKVSRQRLGPAAASSKGPLSCASRDPRAWPASAGSG